ncbi:MAG: glycosyltransferase family 4 protein [Dehalococcoidia bacterium]
MNIVQVSHGWIRIPVEAGAVGVVVLNLSRELVRMGHNVVILDRKYSKGDPDVEYIDGVKIIRLASRRFDLSSFEKGRFVHIFSGIRMALNHFVFALSANSYLARAKDIDIIHTHTSIIGLVLAWLSPSLRNRLIYSSHSPRRLMKSPSFLDRLALLPENKLASLVKKTIVNDERVRAKLTIAAKMKLPDIVTVHFGVDLDRFNPNIDGIGIRQKYGLEGKDVILFVGTINERKGVEYLVKAANIVVNEYEYRNVSFLLVGPVEAFGLKEDIQTPYMAKTLSLIKNYGLKQNVKLTGLVPQEELGSFYAACDIFVLPTLGEATATPSVVLEAMACGRPVVVTRVGGMPVQVRDRHSSFLVDPADEKQLAQMIAYLIDNREQAKEMGAYGRRIAEEEFNWNRIAERILQVYEAVVSPSEHGNRND